MSEVRAHYPMSEWHEIDFLAEGYVDIPVDGHLPARVGGRPRGHVKKLAFLALSMQFFFFFFLI